MLAHRLRRWANISPALGQRLVFGGTCSGCWLGYCTHIYYSRYKVIPVRLSILQSKIDTYAHKLAQISKTVQTYGKVCHLPD